MEVSFTI